MYLHIIVTLRYPPSIYLQLSILGRGRTCGVVCSSMLDDNYGAAFYIRHCIMSLHCICEYIHPTLPDHSTHLCLAIIIFHHCSIPNVCKTAPRSTPWHFHSLPEYTLLALSIRGSINLQNCIFGMISTQEFMASKKKFKSQIDRTNTVPIMEGYIQPSINTYPRSLKSQCDSMLCNWQSQVIYKTMAYLTVGSWIYRSALRLLQYSGIQTRAKLQFHLIIPFPCIPYTFITFPSAYKRSHETVHNLLTNTPRNRVISVKPM